MTQVRNKEAKLEAGYREEAVGGLSPLGEGSQVLNTHAREHGRFTNTF